MSQPTCPTIKAFTAPAWWSVTRIRLKGCPEMAETISNVENAFEMISGVSPSLRGYARWAIRGFAYDDDVAIDATMTGMCQAGPSAKDKAVIEKAIKASQFRP
ncbi:hypothetical protein [Aquabacterium sp.]|uniref:hypothetical protein n=1 Tax=Aquabacterium sp. TaxID=1872578 RepID=UPI002617B067|nr:hypothetical protein [Aquabacterium sp.]MDD2976221.1 hypothetical protein [Aquabacterium sp.]